MWNLRCAHLLMPVLNLMSENTKARFSEYLDSGRLDRSLNKMMRDGLFPDWFAKEFSYDPLYGRVNELRTLLSGAAFNGLLRLDGTHFQYHLELSEYLIDYLLTEVPLEKEKACVLAEKLNELLTQNQKLPT